MQKNFFSQLNAVKFFKITDAIHIDVGYTLVELVLGCPDLDCTSHNIDKILCLSAED